MNLGHGGNVCEIKRKYGISEIIDFSANINPMGLSENVHKAMIEGLKNIDKYPDITYYDLKKSISEYEGCLSNSILLGNGAAEVIFNVVRALNLKKALLIAPTFSEYEDALNSIGCTISHYILKDKYSLDEDFLNNIDDSLDIIFLCNPNNPTGYLIERDFSIKVLEKAKENNVTVVFDESFLDFVKNGKEYSLSKCLNNFNNLIIVKSLTKLFAFPGIRLGYGLCDNIEYVEKINKISVPWSINTVSDYAGRQALKEKDYIEESIYYVREENKFLYDELKKIKDIEVFEGAVNFLFFKFNSNLDLKEALIRKGILIRSCENYVGLDNSYYRIAVRRRNENLYLIKALNEII